MTGRRSSFKAAHRISRGTKRDLTLRCPEVSIELPISKQCKVRCGRESYVRDFPAKGAGCGSKVRKPTSGCLMHLIAEANSKTESLLQFTTLPSEPRSKTSNLAATSRVPLRASHAVRLHAEILSNTSRAHPGSFPMCSARQNGAALTVRHSRIAGSLLMSAVR